MNAPRPKILDEEDARLFLDGVGWGWSGRSFRLVRLKFYPDFLARLLAVESHGERDGLIGAAAQIFGCTIRSIRADIRAAEELRRVEMMAKLPPRHPGDAAA